MLRVLLQRRKKEAMASPDEESAHDPELEEQLGVFREFINSLDVDDLEKPKQE